MELQEKPLFATMIVDEVIMVMMLYLMNMIIQDTGRSTRSMAINVKLKSLGSCFVQFYEKLCICFQSFRLCFMFFLLLLFFWVLRIPKLFIIVYSLLKIPSMSQLDLYHLMEVVFGIEVLFSNIFSSFCLLLIRSVEKPLSSSYRCDVCIWFNNRL